MIQSKKDLKNLFSEKLWILCSHMREHKQLKNACYKIIINKNKNIIINLKWNILMLIYFYLNIYVLCYQVYIQNSILERDAGLRRDTAGSMCRWAVKIS